MNETVNRIIYEWGVRCFGRDHMHDPKVRAVRLIEEAIELAQSVNVPKEQILQALTIVYNRPVGNPLEELGGVFVSTIVMCQCLGFIPEKVIEREVCRCIAKSPEAMRARNDEKLILGLTGGAR